ncbi:Transmembrane protein 62 [Apophysomyces sp. BC1034]|nr:Transmembrane protein 62 [Apophysomyces sp. BC1021]KAG0183983.1 Transmembrane protein 62 [Apophysomyces sp. BC1034]
MVTGTTSQDQTFRDLAHHFSVYLCGHLHRLVAGLGDVLQSYDPHSDSLELELADMKDHGAYRIIAVDNDLISFVDAELPLAQIADLPLNPAIPLSDTNKIIWPDVVHPAPVILITNPKSSQLILEKEPLARIPNSDNIRFLVFSEIDPKKLTVHIFVDDKKHPFPGTYVGGTAPLWITPWDANDFDDLETHTLHIQVHTPDGRVGESKIVFRVDGVRTDIGGPGKWIISSTLSSMFRRSSLFAVLVLLSLLLIPRVVVECKVDPRPSRILLRIHDIDNGDLVGGPYQGIYRQFLVWSLRFLRLAEDQPVVWYGTLIMLLSLVSLPWFRAEFIPSGATTEERFGTLYMWGLVLSNEWVPLADTWVFALFRIVFDVGVFLVLFAWRVIDTSDLHCRNSEKAKRHARQLNEHGWFKGVEVLYWLWRASELVSFAALYGGLWPTLVLNLLSVWLIFVAVMLAGSKGGFLSKRERQRIGIVLEGCSGCRYESIVPPDAGVLVGQPEGEDGISLPSSPMTDEDLQSSSSASATSFEDRLRVKNRKHIYNPMMTFRDERLEPSSYAFIRWLKLDQFEPERAVTSYFVSSTILFCIRVALALYSTIVLWADIGWCIETGQFDHFFAYFTHLTFIGLHAYFLTTLYHHARYLLNSCRPATFLGQPATLNYLYVYLYHTIITYNIITPLVYWLLLSGEVLGGQYVAPMDWWLTISLHGATAFMMFTDVMLNRMVIYIRMVIFVFLTVVVYMLLTFIIFGTEGWWVYSFLDWKQGPSAAIWYLMVSSFVIICFFLQVAIHAFRRWVGPTPKKTRPPLDVECMVQDRHFMPLDSSVASHITLGQQPLESSLESHITIGTTSTDYLAS